MNGNETKISGHLYARCQNIDPRANTRTRQNAQVFHNIRKSTAVVKMLIMANFRTVPLVSERYEDD